MHTYALWSFHSSSGISIQACLPLKTHHEQTPERTVALWCYCNYRNKTLLAAPRVGNNGLIVVNRVLIGIKTAAVAAAAFT